MSAANGVVVNAYRREDEQWKECWNIRVAVSHLKERTNKQKQDLRFGILHYIKVFVDEQGFTMEQELDECVKYLS